MMAADAAIQIWNHLYQDFAKKIEDHNKEIIDKFKIEINYNQEIDSKTSCMFACENEEIAKSVAQCLKEEKINNKDKIFEL